jgi:hypothetical protein
VDTGAYLLDKGLGIVVHEFEALEHAVRDLIQNTDKRRAMGQLARPTAVRDFLLETNTDHLERLLAEHGVPGPKRSQS